MLRDLKLITLGTMQKAGFSRVFRSSKWRARRLLILGYHGISQNDEHLWKPNLFVTPEQFRSHLETIKRHEFTVLALGEAVERLYSDRLPDKAVSITFDDGNIDFYRKAYPIIKDVGFHVTVYLTTYYCCNNKPVFPPALSYILWKGRVNVAPYPDMLKTDEMMDLRTAEGRETVLRRIRRFADTNELSADGKHELLGQVASCVGYDFESLLSCRLQHLMNPQEVSEIARDAIDIQMHAHRHRRPLDKGLYQREIVENRAIIEEITGNRPAHFCYPVGRTHPRFLDWLTEEGVVSAVTCYSGLAGSKSNVLLLPRLICNSTTSPLEFSAWLSGYAALLPRRQHVPVE